MKIHYQSVQVATVAALSLTCALAIPDTPGTKTFVISLATTDNGQLIPVVLSSNSNGFETVSMPNTNDIPLDIQDSDANVEYLENSSILEETSFDEQVEPNESADLEIPETTQKGEAAYDSDSDAEDNADPASKDSDSSNASSYFSNVLTLTVALGISSIATIKF
ncbi:hypothetical protein H4S08_000641 [Coemansia sp. RSA 1365]|nr:hypothetical protein H4S08_000641 [Coemansia sp. RSA 1365]